MKSFLTFLPLILPMIYSWAEKQESKVLEEGIPLTESQMIDARRAGVAFPEKIRVCKVKDLPRPDHDELMFVAKQIGLFSDRSIALSLGYGIYLQEASWENRQALVHEFVHVSQHEKRNGLRPFISDYLRECIDPGYPFGAMEQEALVVSKDICKPDTVKLPA